MSTWLPPTAAEQPDVTLTNWAAFEVNVARFHGPTIHLVGFAECEGTGRVTSPVAKLDAGSRCAVTSTGRVYRLAGAPGLNGDGHYVWQVWQRSWKATVLSDATGAIEKQFASEGACDD
jgi:hypothetical protein